MIYDRSSTHEKWTIMKYMNDFDLMTTYAYALRASNILTNENIGDILNQMERDDIYHPRNGGSIDTGKFKIIQIAWYMFGYYDNVSRNRLPKKLVFTPLGNLLLDNLKDKEKVSKIFLAMLFANGFRQPFSRMDNRFNIYAFRLIFKLLRDERLGNKLYHDEAFYYAMFCKEITEERYEELIEDILKFRQIPSLDKYNLFKRDESVIAQALHEWNYAAKLLAGAGILNIAYGDSIGVLVHGNQSGRRRYTESYVTVRTEIINFMDIMLENYPYYEVPYSSEELQSSFDSEIILKMYSFYPLELLGELGIDNEEQEKISNLLKIATEINKYSTNENPNDFNRFEFALRDAFSLFSDVKAEKIGGSGNTDVECLYYPSDSNQVKKFDLEAKARRVKLMEVSAGRLKLHRKKIGSTYTIIVTPDYVHAVLDDIRYDRTVIIKSATLSNYMYQYITRFGRNISYMALDNIVEENLGNDITNIVTEYIYDNFGHTLALNASGE